MAESRLIGQYPVIGIRPVIDARRGMLKVRESLEEQTMNMARAAADLFRENLRYTNGEPVKVVISDTTIGRVAETARCADQFKREGVDITLTVTPCWCYGSETMDMDPMTIKGVWGFNGTERPGAVYLAAVLAGNDCLMSVGKNNPFLAVDMLIPDALVDGVQRSSEYGISDVMGIIQNGSE